MRVSAANKYCHCWQGEREERFTKRNRYILCGDFEFFGDGENWNLTNLTGKVDKNLWGLR